MMTDPSGTSGRQGWDPICQAGPTRGIIMLSITALIETLILDGVAECQRDFGPPFTVWVGARPPSPIGCEAL